MIHILLSLRLCAFAGASIVSQGANGIDSRRA